MQFVTPHATANGREILDGVCVRDDLLESETREIGDTLASIKVIGPKVNANDVLMELPNRK